MLGDHPRDDAWTPAYCLGGGRRGVAFRRGLVLNPDLDAAATELAIAILVVTDRRDGHRGTNRSLDGSLMPMPPGATTLPRLAPVVAAVGP
jgi:hypothetical protein